MGVYRVDIRLEIGHHHAIAEAISVSRLGIIRTNPYLPAGRQDH